MFTTVKGMWLGIKESNTASYTNKALKIFIDYTF